MSSCDLSLSVFKKNTPEEPRRALDYSCAEVKTLTFTRIYGATGTYIRIRVGVFGARLYMLVMFFMCVLAGELEPSEPHSPHIADAHGVGDDRLAVPQPGPIRAYAIWRTRNK